MNISDSIKKLSTGVDKPALDKATANTAATTAAPASESSTDSVTLSATSVQLAGLGNGEAFDAKKVGEIKAAIARGEFSVDTGKVADGLLQTVKDLIQPNKG